MENLGKLLLDAGLRFTTWFDFSGRKVTLGDFDPTVPLFDEHGTEIPGALQKRMGIPAGTADFQPGYGHAQRQALFAGMVQRALDAGYFRRWGIEPGPRVDGPTSASGFDRTFLLDVAYLLTAARANSEIVLLFADTQPAPVDPASIDQTIAELADNHPRPWRLNPAGRVHTPKAPGHPGDPLSAEERRAWYEICALKLAALGPVDLVTETCSIDPVTYVELFGPKPV